MKMMMSTIRRSKAAGVTITRGGPGSGPHWHGGRKPYQHKDRVARAKAAHHMVDSKIQRYAEEKNEPEMAKALGGLSYKDNEPVDIVMGDEGVVKHGIELKTVISNKAGKITMKGEALARKRTWARNNKAQFHTVVLDDSRVYNAGGEGVHDISQRKILYRRGAGSFRLSKMHVCKDTDELKTLINTPTKKLPSGAK